MPSDILKIESTNRGGGGLLFDFHWLDEHADMKKAVIDFMSEHQYTYMEDYTINSISHLSDSYEAKRIAVWFKDPEDFVMMKLAVDG